MSRRVTRLRVLKEPPLARFYFTRTSKTRRLHAVAVDHSVPVPLGRVARRDQEHARTSEFKSNSNTNHRLNANSPLSLLPFSDLLRSWAITAVSSYPSLLKPSLRLMAMFAHSSSPIFSPDRNPLLRFLLKKTFYAHFCAGETMAEVADTSKRFKDIGYRGVILAYGKEIVLGKNEKVEILKADASQVKETADPVTEKEILTWKEGTFQTLEISRPGDFVALKFSGAGRDVMRRLAAGLGPGEAMEKAMVETCERAADRNIGLLFDAEQTAVQQGIDAWTMDFQRRYNQEKALVFGTYQAYLKATPHVLTQHLSAAQRDGFVLGIKLVRGAYMSSDPRDHIWETKEQTDNVYDGIVRALATKTWNEILHAPQEQHIMPRVNLVLASHNIESVKKAMAIRRQQTLDGREKIPMSYGQLMGMADEVSCELVMAAKQGERRPTADGEVAGPSAYKYCVWGSVSECMKYLVRRAEENRDSLSRSTGTRIALAAEIRRRLLG